MDIGILFISLGSMGGIGLALALILVMADKKLAVKEDPRTEKALEVLPGSNCGACGYGGCAAFARALTEGKASPNGCRAGGSEVAEALAEIMGEKALEQTKKVARVFCSGGEEETVKDKVYT
ncbi:MAG: RnfABCDGE type electron transport complex subunit B, partial [Spirochaetota bacterium]